MGKEKIKFLVISSAPTILEEGQLYAYSPYVDEMELWFKYCDYYKIISPSEYPNNFLSKPFQNKNIIRYKLPFLGFSSFKKSIISLCLIPSVVVKLFKAMYWANHIHFRCPGNIPFIASFMQVFFPSKTKSVKYAGNWDPKSKQPISYKIQKYIFSNTLLTRNTKVLVYGYWPKQSINIKVFFTATFRENEIEDFFDRDYSSQLKFVFIGGLVSGKRPLLALEIIKALQEKGLDCIIEVYGDGALKNELETYIGVNNLTDSVTLHGNQNREVIKLALKQSHFTILPSKSEGWPKALAEGMFFGCIPISTKISCVPWMLDDGKRGILIEAGLDDAVNEIQRVIKNENLNEMSKAAQLWSQEYTVEKQVSEIKKILAL